MVWLLASLIHDDAAGACIASLLRTSDKDDTDAIDVIIKSICKYSINNTTTYALQSSAN